MLGKKADRWQEDLFIACPLSSLIPDDHILRQVDKVLDLSWLRDEVKHLYCENNGRASIDPEVAVRLMLAGLFQGIKRDRKLMREAQVNIAIRWFAGFKLDEDLPSHSSLTRIRQRWGEQLFKAIFKRTVESCVNAGIVDAKTIHIDATLIRADVSWESLTTTHIEDVIRENKCSDTEQEQSKPNKQGRPRTKEKHPKKHSTTDSDATMATSCRTHHLAPSFKQHTAVETKSGVVVDVDVSTGEANEGKQLMEQVERIEQATGEKIDVLTGDSGYAHSANYAALEQRGTQAVIPPQKERSKSKKIPLRRFKYDGKHEIVRCPAAKIMRKSVRNEKHGGWIYRMSAKVCRACKLRNRCLSPSARSRTVFISDGYESMLRARRHRPQWSESEKQVYDRHRGLVEGRHGEAKSQHGLDRAARRGLENVAIQSYLTAAVMNLKRLAAAFLHDLSPLFSVSGRVMAFLNQPRSIFA